MEPTSMLSFDAPSGWGLKVVCPVCGFGYVHFKKPVAKKGNDKYEAWDGKGDCIEIEMYCEEGHEWKVVLGAHKGNAFLFIDKP